MECANGHRNADGIRYCGECGLSLSPTSVGANEGHNADAHSFLPPPPAYVPLLPPQSSRRKWSFLLGAVILLGAGFMVMRDRGASDEVTLRGIAGLKSPDIEGNWDSCSGTGSNADLREGTFVSLTDAAGTKIGATSLRNVETSDYAWMAKASGEAGKLPTDIQKDLERKSGLLCVLVWDVAVKPSEFYDLKLGRRGGGTYSYNDLRADGFVILVALRD